MARQWCQDMRATSLLAVCDTLWHTHVGVYPLLAVAVAEACARALLTTLGARACPGVTGMLRHVARVVKLDAVAAAVACEKTEAKLAVVPRLLASAKATVERVHC